MSNFAARFRSLRIRDGLTQDELAQKLKISKSAISMYENGNREPDFETLELIADFFNVDMNYLLGSNVPIHTPIDQDQTSGHQPEYYLDPETAAKAQEIYEDSGARILLDAKRDLSAEDLNVVLDMIKALKAKENNND